MSSWENIAINMHKEHINPRYHIQVFNRSIAVMIWDTFEQHTRESNVSIYCISVKWSISKTLFSCTLCIIIKQLLIHYITGFQNFSTWKLVEHWSNLHSSHTNQSKVYKINWSTWKQVRHTKMPYFQIIWM